MNKKKQRIIKHFSLIKLHYNLKKLDKFKAKLIYSKNHIKNSQVIMNI